MLLGSRSCSGDALLHFNDVGNGICIITVFDFLYIVLLLSLLLELLFIDFKLVFYIETPW